MHPPHSTIIKLALHCMLNGHKDSNGWDKLTNVVLACQKLVGWDCSFEYEVLLVALYDCIFKWSNQLLRIVWILNMNNLIYFIRACMHDRSIGRKLPKPKASAIPTTKRKIPKAQFYFLLDNLWVHKLIWNHWGSLSCLL